MRRGGFPPSTLVLGLVVLVFFTALAVVSDVLANETTTWWTTAVFVGFAALSLSIIADYFLARPRLAHAPAGVIDREALPVLEATAPGRPPPVWG